jgi:PBP1b-binding outer membrane lipoprotein LpoB
MKNKLLLLTLLALSFAGCRTIKQSVVSDSVQRVERVQLDSVVVRKAEQVEAKKIPKETAVVSIPAAALDALPPNAIFQQTSGRASVQVSKDSVGNITAEARCDSLEILIKNITSEYERYRAASSDSIARSNTQVETVQGQSSWASFERWCGRIFMGLLVLIGIYFILKWKFKF